MEYERKNHDPETFLDVLSDYFSRHEVEISRSLGRLVLKRCLGERDEFRPAYALRYGKYLLLVNENGLKPPAQTILILDPGRCLVSEHGLR